MSSIVRRFENTDMERVLDIWLEASLKAHHFVSADFWRGQVENMRNIYLPASELYVIESQGQIAGFYALHGNVLAAIFVSTVQQGKGLGATMIDDAKSHREELLLNVYKQNTAAYGFYQSQGFLAIGEEIDEHNGEPSHLMRWA